MSTKSVSTKNVATKEQTPKAKRLILLIIIALLIPIIPFLVIGELPGEQWLQSTGDSTLLFAITGTLLLAADVLLPIPSSILGTLMGAKLGFFPGFTAILVGLTLGNLVGYLVGRFFYQHNSDHLPATPTLLTVFLSRPVPILAETTSIFSGAVKVPFAQYFFVSLLGNSLYSFFLASNGILVADDNAIIYGILFALAVPSLAWLVWKFFPSMKKHFFSQ